MLTRLSKIFAVFTAAISVFILAVVWVATMVGGPNWQAEADAVPEFEFTRTDDPQNPTWSATPRSEKRNAEGRLGRTPVAQNEPILPSAIVKARDSLKTEQQTELTRLETEIPLLQNKIKESAALITTDLAAIKAREQSLVAELEAIHAEIDKTTRDSIAKAQEVKTIRDEVEKRRNDGYRLRNELEALRADRYRMKDQQRKLEDLLVRMQGSNARLEAREAQLVASGATDPRGDEPYDDSRPAAGASGKPAEPKPDEPKPAEPKPDEPKSEEPKSDN